MFLSYRTVTTTGRIAIYHAIISRLSEINWYNLKVTVMPVKIIHEFGIGLILRSYRILAYYIDRINKY